MRLPLDKGRRPAYAHLSAQSYRAIGAGSPQSGPISSEKLSWLVS
jgi:hypothetical protein